MENNGTSTTLFDDIYYFNPDSKEKRNQQAVKDFMKETKLDDIGKILMRINYFLDRFEEPLFGELNLTIYIVFCMFKFLSNFRNWRTKIEQAEAKGDFSSKQNAKCLQMIKNGYDKQLTLFFDSITNKQEEKILKLSDEISDYVDGLTADQLLEDIENTSQKNGDAEEIKSQSDKLVINFQMDDLSERKPLKIIHFNDVYNIEEGNGEIVGGYSRFYSALKAYEHAKPLILFSGDIFSPSKLSLYFEGEQMMPFLKKAGIHCACVGNHDFDFGVEKLGEFISRTDFPWLLSNVKCAKTGEMLSNTVEHVVLSHEGYKIALIGLAEIEWIETLKDLDLKDLEFEPQMEWAKRYVKSFKHDQSGIDFLIAITHMRTPRDIILSKEVPELDLIIGGHDHHRVNHQFNNTLVKKSGCDFREFSVINMSLHDKEASEFSNLSDIVDEKADDWLPRGVVIKDLSKFNLPHKTLITEFELVEITKRFPRDPELYEEVIKFSKDIEEKMKAVVGYTAVDLHAKFTQIRNEETNIGNMLADMINHANKSDCTIVNAGTFRIDKVIPAGVLKMQEIMDTLPQLDPCVVVKVPGHKLHGLLESGVSSYPEYQGKFPSISGIELTFDPSKPKGERIEKDDIKVGGEPIDYDRDYTVSAKSFIAKGKDGYVDFIDCEWVIKEDDAITLTNLVIHNFKMLEERIESEELKELLRIVGNEEAELSPEIERDNGETTKFIMIKPKVDGRLKMKKQ